MSLTDFILNFDNTSFYEADVFQITLANGFVIRATSHMNDLVIGGQTYFATKFGKWARDSFSFEPNAVTEANITMTADSTILFPNSTSTPMFQRSKLFARARVQVTIAYLDLNEIVQGSQVIFVGVISAPSVESSLVTFKCTDYLYLLQASWPARVIGAGAPFTVFDPLGGLNAESFAVTRTVLSGSSGSLLQVSTLASVGNDALPYTKGYIVPTSGEAQGWTIGIVTQSDTTHIQLAPFDIPIAVGDTIKLYPGDDGTLATWTNKYSNAAKFPGFPFVPGPQTSVVGG